MKEIYISHLNCKNKIIQIESTSALFLPLFGEPRVTKNSLPAYCEWAIGSRVIDIISSDGKFIPNNTFVKNPLYDIKKSTKTSLIDVYNTADLRQTR